MSKIEQPRDLLIYGDLKKNEIFLNKWLEWYEKVNPLNRKEEIYWYSEDPKKRSYDHKKIAIFKEMNYIESWFEFQNILNEEIKKLKLINPRIIILITINKITLSYIMNGKMKWENQINGILAVSSNEINEIDKLFKILKFKHSY